MPDPRPGGFGRFLSELRRRHVFRATVAYAAVAFVVLQAAEIILPAFDLPEWGLRLVVVFAALGLPVAVVLAWVYEITAQGIRTMSALDAEAGIRRDEASMVPRLALLAVTLTAVGAAGWWWFTTDVPDPDAAAASRADEGFVAPAGDATEVPIRSLAVLPLESFSAEAEAGYFAAGMQEALISRLSQLGSVRVISRTSVNAYGREGKSVTQVGRELGVEGVVEGSVLLDDAGERVRITVQLIHAPSDAHLWSGEYEEELTDIIALQRNVADAIAAEIQGTLEATPQPDERVADAAPAQPADPEAAMADMKGRGALNDESPGALDAAERFFTMALEEDSSYTPAVVGHVNTQLLKSLRAGDVPEEVLSSAEERLRRVVRLDPGSPEAREMLALVRMAHNLDSMDFGVVVPGGDLPGGASVFAPTTEMASELQARIVSAGAVRAAARGRLDAARSLVSIGRLDEAGTILEAAVQDDPGDEGAWDLLERLRIMRGDPEGAVDVRRRREAAVPPVPGAPDADRLSAAVRRDGLRGYWSWRIAELEARRRAGRPIPPVEMAAALAGAGRRDEALDRLEEANRVGDPGLATLRVDPVWDPYRTEPRFSAVVREAFGRPGGD